MKKFLTVLCCVLTFGLALAGCATVSDISNSSSEVIYNGNAAVMVDGYLYYGNSYAGDISSFTELSEIDSAAASSYLARLNTNIEREAKGQNFTPLNTEKVNGDLIASNYQFMFVLGDYIYYLKPDRHRYESDGSSSYKFNYSVLCSVGLNGNNAKEVFTFEGEVSRIEVLKYDGSYYIVALANSKLYSIKLNNGWGDAKFLSVDSGDNQEEVSSVAIPETYQANLKGYSQDWNGTIYYTATNADGDNIVKQVKVNDKDSAKEIKQVGGTVSFLYRQNDLIFYTYTNSLNQTQVYYNDVANATSSDEVISTTRESLFSNLSSISNVYVINTTSCQTVIYKDADGTQKYKNNKGGSGLINFYDENGTMSTDYQIMFINSRTAYMITGTNIYEADFSTLTNSRTSQNIDITARTIVTMTAIQTSGNLYSYDGEYIYYYAQLEELTEEEQAKIDAEKKAAGIEEETDDSEESAITDQDAGYYLYRVRINDSKYELIGMTQFEERHSNYVYKK